MCHAAFCYDIYNVCSMESINTYCTLFATCKNVSARLGLSRVRHAPAAQKWIFDRQP